jgi:hypothetical protein
MGAFAMRHDGVHAIRKLIVSFGIGMATARDGGMKTLLQG